MTDHRRKLSARKQKALDALRSGSFEDAALAAGVRPRTLRQWMKEPEFSAAQRDADKADHMHAMLWLRQGLGMAVKSTVQIMYHGDTPALRLRAARDIIRLARESIELADLVAVVEDAERLVAAAGRRALPAGRAGSVRGHGAKFPRKKDKAITELLAHRSIAQAAGAAGIGTQTLYDWLKNPEFAADLAARAAAVFFPAMRPVHRHQTNAVALIRDFSANMNIPQATRLEAARAVEQAEKTGQMEDLRARTAVMAAGAGSGEPVRSPKTLGREIWQTVKRIVDGLPRENRPGESGFEYVYASDGRPAGHSSETGPDGGQIWLVPPPGARKGDSVPDEVAA